MPFTRSAPLRTPQERPGPSPYAFIHPSAWKECSKKLPCENKGKANEEEAHVPGARGGDRLGRLHRPQPADGGEGKVRRLRREAARASGDRVLLGRGDGGAGWHGRRPGPERDGGLRGLPPILITRGLRTSALRSSPKLIIAASLQGCLAIISPTEARHLHRILYPLTAVARVRPVSGSWKGVAPWLL